MAYTLRAFGGTIILNATLASSTSMITFSEFNSLSAFATDSYTPRYVGDLADALQCTFVQGDGKTPYDLTNATSLQMTFHNLNTSTPVIGSGNWTVTNAAQGKATYTWSSLDVATAGIYIMVPKMSVNGLIKHFSGRTLEILTA